MKGLGSSITKGLQTGSRLICNDNSGAKIVQIIGVKGAKAKRAMYPKVGVSDIVTVLDGLGWDSAYLMGHSWGGHLVFHAAVSIPDRVFGVLSVDPLGAVGDGQA